MIAQIVDDNTITIYDHSQFSVPDILHSGQVFRYFPEYEGYYVVVGREWARLTVFPDKTHVHCSNSNYFWNYFDLNTDYNQIKNELKRFKCMEKPIESSGKIRILRSDFNEMVISFIISANNNIKRFTKTLNRIAEKYGDMLECGFHSFPTIQQLASATEDDFKRFGCGYRASYLTSAVLQLQQLNVEEIKLLPQKMQSNALQSIKGVGAKVAACVMLFSDIFHNLSICPLDTWLNFALTQIPESEHSVLLNHPYAGVAQQYIFHHLQHLHLPL